MLYAGDVNLEPALSRGVHRNIPARQAQRHRFLTFGPDAKADRVRGNELRPPMFFKYSGFHQISSNDLWKMRHEYKIRPGLNACAVDGEAVIFKDVVYD